MSREQFHVDVERSGEGVRVDLITPDGELLTVGQIDNPAQVMGFAVMFGSMMSAMITQAIFEVRG
ncbi:hypothetical protein E4T66_20460 [Sinimarinibacterium sp. CAU 1509]|uniref:hypothetical protein n=1 Tax=Sinimarinibacterium sp. CAU 1509 TaxID=2562283 RepID=UPI0010AB5468|nr:hypothetical protein [Sinimarinibacterium sp. CAU 1509]TJY55756.1 hypothetical protein E4T66_20460 [Sinimarinibacterium sp. CAU 1509]